MPTDDKLELRRICEPLIQKYLRSPRQIADIRSLCYAVAEATAKESYPVGFAEGLMHARAEQR